MIISREQAEFVHRVVLEAIQLGMDRQQIVNGVKLARDVVTAEPASAQETKVCPHDDDKVVSQDGVKYCLLCGGQV